MPTRSIEIEGLRWNVFPSGYVTVNDGDEFGLLFVRGAGDQRVVRSVRYSPRGTRSRGSLISPRKNSGESAIVSNPLTECCNGPFLSTDGPIGITRPTVGGQSCTPMHNVFEFPAASKEFSSLSRRTFSPSARRISCASPFGASLPRSLSSPS